MIRRLTLGLVLVGALAPTLARADLAITFDENGRRFFAESCG
jgi:hypothetical protein